jgi:hypothetical protein
MNAIATACHGSLSILRLSQESCKDSKPTVEIIVELKGDKLCGCLLCSSGDSTHIRAITPSPPESSPHYALHMHTRSHHERTADTHVVHVLLAQRAQ